MVKCLENKITVGWPDSWLFMLMSVAPRTVITFVGGEFGGMKSQGGWWKSFKFLICKHWNFGVCWNDFW